ncbi:3D domain-containing protein [Paenibacillus sp. J5C_2022]|uniref:3D domain-containing protein n=1 Tax=Paenibacillus sp. J5C2022 TaxID=2977129 RepID=UPI0021D024BB|nr:3D domain-containing protein [Paenibacillus sp. J5C2022]MCU6709243.1 3D domain-containing protein [Paenibacillus sp. J5C2022]
MKKSIIISAAIALSISLSAGTTYAASSHTVVSNDTFWKLSQQYNIALEQLMSANAGLDPLNLQIGTKLVIPGTITSMNANEAAPVQPEAKTVMAPSGVQYTYAKQLNVKATAYTASAAENGGWAGLDYFGNKLKVGTVAVDPKMIPLGTKLYVTGYQYNGLPAGGMLATATDMGGSIKGNRIDLFVPGTTQQASKFGIQDVQVYILK